MHAWLVLASASIDQVITHTQRAYSHKFVSVSACTKKNVFFTPRPSDPPRAHNLAMNKNAPVVKYIYALLQMWCTVTLPRSFVCLRKLCGIISFRGGNQQLSPTHTAQEYLSGRAHLFCQHFPLAALFGADYVTRGNLLGCCASSLA